MITSIIWKIQSQFTGKPTEAHGIELASTTEHSKSPRDLNTVRNQDLPEHLQCMLPEESSLTNTEMQHVKTLIREFDDIFTSPDGKVVFHVYDEITKMLEGGQIRRSKSPWRAPIVLVRKKDGTLRFCIDFHTLNNVTVKDAYPLPRIDECLDALNGSKYFSTLDLASG